jgi:Smg protein
MKDRGGRVISVLRKMFRYHADQDGGFDGTLSSIKPKLQASGFSDEHIEEAWCWLVALLRWDQYNHIVPPSSSSIRIFTPSEYACFGDGCLSYLMQLEQLGILNSQSRELVMDRVMALPFETVELALLHWVVLVVVRYYDDDARPKHTVAWLTQFMPTESIN